MQSRQYNFFWKYSVVKIPYNMAENIKLKFLFIPNLSKMIIMIEMHIIEAIKTKNIFNQHHVIYSKLI